MRKIYTSVDLGSDSIKVAVIELIDGACYNLASTTYPSRGIKKGWVVDVNLASASLKEALKETEEMLGLSINQAIVSIPSYNRSFQIGEGSVKVEGEEGIIDYDDVIRVLQDATVGKVEEGKRLVMTMPISFHVDQGEGVKNPVSMKGEELSVKAVVTSVPKENVENVLTVLEKCGVKAIDFTLGEIGDYYAVKNKEYDRKVGALINIGYDTTKIAIYNKGILIKNEILKSGSKNIDKDIRYVYHLDKKTARYLKENFAVSNKRYADVNDTMEVINTYGEKITINQLELSEVVEARIVELLKDAKKQINVLTNREISYIIITGGISELAGFQYVVDNVLGRDAVTLSITSMGLRNNKYSTVVGICKYFDEKLTLRGRKYSMFSEVTLASRKKEETGNVPLVSKVFNHIFDHN